jgi:hypothetical protein
MEVANNRLGSPLSKISSKESSAHGIMAGYVFESKGHLGSLGAHPIDRPLNSRCRPCIRRILSPNYAFRLTPAPSPLHLAICAIRGPAKRTWRSRLTREQLSLTRITFTHATCCANWRALPAYGPFDFFSSRPSNRSSPSRIVKGCGGHPGR